MVFCKEKKELIEETKPIENKEIGNHFFHQEKFIRKVNT